MLIIYHPEAGFSFTEMVLEKPVLRALYDQWGDAGLIYVALFSHPLSIHTNLDDLAERDAAVTGEMKARKWGKPSGRSQAMPHALYKDESYEAWADELLRFKSIPDMKRLSFLETEQDSNRQAMKGIVLTPSEPEKMQKQISAKQKLQELINDNDKEIARIQEDIANRIGAGGIISMDVLWNEI